MVEQCCPWCEATFLVDMAAIAQGDKQTCPECLTSWLFEEPEIELALAA